MTARQHIGHRQRDRYTEWIQVVLLVLMVGLTFYVIIR